MFKIKYLFLVLLLSVTSFAIMSPKEARRTADKINSTKVKEQLPVLLKEIEAAIKQQSLYGYYNATLDVEKYEVFTVTKAIDIISSEGYNIGPLTGYTGKRLLSIEW